VEPSLGVIVPAYNEEATIARVVERVLAQACVAEVVLVDDGSTDATWSRVQRFKADSRVTFLRHDRNRGKGAAVRTGLEAISAPVVIVQDADLEYDPGQYPKLIEPIMEGETDVVYGVRGFLGHTAYSYWFVVGNRLVTWVTNVLYNCYIHDMETGFKAFRTDLMRRLRLRGTRFDIEPDVTARVLRLGYRIYEVPITYHARGRAEGKKLTWRDGISALRTLLRVRLSSRQRLFGAEDPYHAERIVALGRKDLAA
jgi:glycosyltransferase involved in cell wall biosynthesis